MAELIESYQKVMESIRIKVFRDKISFYDWMEYYELYQLSKQQMFRQMWYNAFV